MKVYKVIRGKCLVFLLGFIMLISMSGCKSSESAVSETPELNQTEALLPMPITYQEVTETSLSHTTAITSTEIVIETPDVTVEITDALPTLDSESSSVFDYPESHYIWGIVGHAQHYYLSCESSAAVDWAWFFGVNIYESTFQADMPRSDNPDLGYVGDYTTRRWGQIPPYSYGVHAGPIAEGLRAYDLPALAVKGYTLDAIKQKLSEDKPIIAWIIGNLEYSEPVEYVDQAGNMVIVAPYEHVVILTGYNAESIRYMNNGKFFDAPTEVFLTSFGVLGNMVVIYE